MTAGVSRSAVSIWGMRDADPSCMIAVVKGIIWDAASRSCVSARVSMWISGDSGRRLSSNAQGDRIFGADDGDRWFYAQLGN